MKLIEHAKQFAKELDDLYGQEEANALFLLVIKHQMNYSKTDFIFKKENEVAIETTVSMLAILQSLKTGKPIQYILGKADFYRLTFRVDKSVLIPRPETEELVEWILSTHPIKLPSAGKSAHLKVIDIGTGSGCIAITLKKNLQQAEVYALDIAQDSLAIAKENALLNGVEVHFIHQDILNENYNPSVKFDIIVSNPPYITPDEKLFMHENVLNHEPHRALFVTNEEPLIFYKAIANFAIKHLNKDGQLYFEINEYLAEQTINMLNDKRFINIELRKDMQGKDRMIRCEL